MSRKYFGKVVVDFSKAPISPLLYIFDKYLCPLCFSIWFYLSCHLSCISSSIDFFSSFVFPNDAALSSALALFLLLRLVLHLILFDMLLLSLLKLSFVPSRAHLYIFDILSNKSMLVLRIILWIQQHLRVFYFPFMQLLLF